MVKNQFQNHISIKTSNTTLLKINYKKMFIYISHWFFLNDLIMVGSKFWQKKCLWYCYWYWWHLINLCKIPILGMMSSFWVIIKIKRKQIWYNFFSLKGAKTSLPRKLRTDSSQCNSTNRQNPLIQQNHRNLWISNAFCMSFRILNLLRNCNLIYFMTESPIFNH